MSYAPFIYRDFYDVPRMILVRHRDRVFILDSSFNDESDDYRDHYIVYELAVEDVSDANLAGSWADLPSRARSCLGSVPLASVTFDATRRQTINTEFLDALLSKPRPANARLHKDI